MIQGIRLTSSNLSGKTADVTFLPSTGGTIDLGTQTIPFNNISDYPYGIYELSVVEYDRTYEINVPAPLTGQTAYTETVRNIAIGEYQPFSGAVLSEVWGTYTTQYITDEGIPSTNIVLAEGICSDDVDAAYLPGNIGGWPTSINSFLGPFMSGGLAGYPFVGSVGFGAFASHVAASSATEINATLFVTSMPHIGVTEEGSSGRMLRRGKADSTNDNTCGAVWGAINQVVNVLSAAPSQSNAPFNNENYSFWKLTDILWPYKSTLTGFTGSEEEVYNQQMIFATETIRDSAYNYIIANLPAATTGNTQNDVYFLSGIFINTDVSTGTTQFESYVVVDKVMKYEFGTGWSDITVDYKAGLPID
jgi:hypothetical protein